MQSYEQTGRRRDEGRGSFLRVYRTICTASGNFNAHFHSPLTNSPLPVMPGPAPGLFSEQRGEEKRRWQMGRKRLLTRPEQLLQSVSPRQRELNAVSGVALAKEEEEVKAEEIKRRLFYVARSFLV